MIFYSGQSMKKIALIIMFCALANFAVFARPRQVRPVKQKQDTVRDLKDQPRPRVVKNRRERMRMQQRQIKYHEKQLKKVHQVQKELRNKDSD